MQSRSRVRRVVLVVMDGLRAEAVRRLELPSLLSLTSRGAWTFSAQTIRPSVTSAAMTSLFTGVAPENHGIGVNGFGIPRDLQRLRPIPQLLTQARLPTHIFIRKIPLHYCWLARRLSAITGVHTLETCGGTSSEIVANAERRLSSIDSGFTFMHWPEADTAGHVAGWKSAEYERRVRKMDISLGRLTALLDLDAGGTVLIVCSDHGGGGVVPTDHNSQHPEDTTIPIVIAGEGVGAVHLGDQASLLDIPPTVLWNLGVDVPQMYGGTVLYEAFRREAQAA